MNWAGSDLVELVLAWLGSLAGVVAYSIAANRGLEAPWLVGLAAGLAVIMFARRRSRTRGLVVGTIAVWSAAAAQAAYLGRAGLLEELARFHASLTPRRWLAFGATALIAVLLGAGSLRRDAPVRRAGT